VTQPGAASTVSAATSLPTLALAVGLGLAVLGGQAGQGFGPVGSLLAMLIGLAVYRLDTGCASSGAGDLASW
jgi:hypothetical protein